MSIYANGVRLLDETDKQPSNLLKGSSDFSGKWYKSDGDVINVSLSSSKDPNSNLSSIYNWSWGGICQPLAAYADEILTWGAYIKIDNPSGNGNLHVYAQSEKGNTGQLIKATVGNTTYNSLSNDSTIISYKANKSLDWVWITATFKMTQNVNKMMIRIENDAGASINIGSMIITKSYDLPQWYPNPLDANTNFLNLRAEIQALKSKLGDKSPL